MTSHPSSRPRRIVGTSLKLYFDLPSTKEYVSGVAQLSDHAKKHNVDLFVIPDFISLLPSKEILSSTSVLLGAQDSFWEDSGAFTGEISPKSLKQAGVRIVEIGHAERRRIFHETDSEVTKKCAAAVKHGLIPLVCIGEKASSPIASAAVGLAVEEVRPQLQAALDGVPDDAEIILAYEPVWAIGAKEPAGADHVVAVTKEIRRMAGERKGVTRILYGGSAGPGLFGKLVEGVDGLFLGRFAHDLANLKKVIEEVGSAE
jgi:triosephosphate isomerase